MTVQSPVRPERDSADTDGDEERPAPPRGVLEELWDGGEGDGGESDQDGT
ncbi:hypothetical protein [Haloarcula amylovorans]|nr:hypothetical protein [Halomicroarcula amylolytica]